MPASRADSLSPAGEKNARLPFIHDVVIVGAGPCGLAVAARLREQTPSALFTDEEHGRYHWINRHAAHASIKNSKTGNVRSCPASPERANDYSMIVLDSSGEKWLSKWAQLFKLLVISHLRSPMFFHPDPQDLDGLLAYSQELGRAEQCLEIAGCVGKEISKHRTKKQRARKMRGDQAKVSITIDERDRKDYFCPPSDLFQDYCNSIATKYNLEGNGLIKHTSVSNIEYNFVPQLSSDEKLFTIKVDKCSYYARIAMLAIGAVKPFDIDLEWMGKFKNHEKASFWSADTDDKRLNLINSARGGGSITSRFAKILDQHVKRGKLSTYTNTVVRDAKFNPLSGLWNIVTEPPIYRFPQIDFVYFATGVQSDFRTLPFLSTLVEKYPMEAYDGLPALTDDLMWGDVLLFMTGKFASLRLDPEAGNLEGARLGAEHIAWAIQDRLGKGQVVQRLSDDYQSGSSRRYASGIGSRFQALEVH